MNLQLHSELTGICTAHLYLAATAQVVESKRHANALPQEALKQYQTDPQFRRRVDNLVSDILAVMKGANV